MGKYIYHEELKKYSNFKVPINRILIFFSHFFLKLLFYFQKSNSKMDVKKVKIKSYDNKKIDNLIFTPKNTQLDDRCLLFIHGGGFVFNGSMHHYKLARKMSTRLKCKTIYIDYRLAPKHKYPVAINDVFSVYKWVLNNCDKLSINKDKIILMGDSAGGNLAATLTNMAYENNLSIPKVNILLYPVLTKGLNTQSYLKYDDTPFCNSKDCKKYEKYYYGKIDCKENNIKAPYDNDIFKKYPFTYIEVAEYDCLHDDGVLFYEKLKENNIKCELIEIKGAMHGYDFAANSNLVNELINKRCDFINKSFELKGEK